MMMIIIMIIIIIIMPVTAVAKKNISADASATRDRKLVSYCCQLCLTLAFLATVHATVLIWETLLYFQANVLFRCAFMLRSLESQQTGDCFVKP